MVIDMVVRRKCGLRYLRLRCFLKEVETVSRKDQIKPSINLSLKSIWNEQNPYKKKITKTNYNFNVKLSAHNYQKTPKKLNHLNFKTISEQIFKSCKILIIPKTFFRKPKKYISGKLTRCTKTQKSSRFLFLLKPTNILIMI